ncbi:MAG: fold metallo-hydrolase [Pseudomonadota bacterium]|jgi:glyoxylase-like metal-dependent hydrolase (beta-lactamase superfamily II)|nr:MBL fold metallo-hydrolase [Burkholderiales bacterium]MBP9768062.1 MBL fold metallo-hydrolase [Burkholderiales bacterium]MDQ5947710.1 fold metallo-hydrolase [Pseudomonadota bacterium]
MLVRQLFDAQTFTFTYIVADNFGSEAIIIDPVDSKVEQYMKLLKELNLKLKYVFDTHVHADHITAAGKLRELTDCITLLGAGTNAKCVSKVVKDGEKIQVGTLEFTVLETPGHTQDSYCLYTPTMVFTGDTLFVRGTGRTDFQAGNPVDQYNSIVNKLFSLPEETLVYPGHDYNGNTRSSIWEEKNFNPRLAGKSVAEFKEIMDNLNLPNPKLMDVAVPANLACGLV